jgi:tetratricopeptide (TPR) repeat protein
VVLAQQGRLDEALAEGKLAAELDPLSSEILVDTVLALALQGNYEGAMEQANRAVDLDPASFLVLRKGDQYRCRENQRRHPRIAESQHDGIPLYVAGWLGYAYGATGDRARAMAVIEELNRKSLHGYVPAFDHHQLALMNRAKNAPGQSPGACASARSAMAQLCGMRRRSKFPTLQS